MQRWHRWACEGLRAWKMPARVRCRGEAAGTPRSRSLSHGHGPRQPGPAGRAEDAAASGAVEGVGRGHRKHVLVRDFVFHSLYAPEIGYFQDQNVVGSVEGSSQPSSDPAGATVERGTAGGVEQSTQTASRGLDFNGMLGEMEYRNTVAQLYGQGGSAWMTPCELFHPWYARAVARFVVEQLRARAASSTATASSQTTGKKMRALTLRVLEVCACRQINPCASVSKHFVYYFTPQVRKPHARSPIYAVARPRTHMRKCSLVRISTRTQR
jgi:hypothetical protein